MWYRVHASGSAGQLIVGTDAKVISPTDGSIVKIGEGGKLWVRSASVAEEYLNNEEPHGAFLFYFILLHFYSDKEKKCAEIFQDGWVRTGDEVHMDKN